jgi:methyl-accepting chemotaxis protein
MRRLDNLSLRSKLVLAPLVCLALLVFSAAGAMWGFAQQRAVLPSIHAERLPRYTFVAELESGIRGLNGLIDRSIGYPSMGVNAMEIDAIDKALAAASARLTKALADRAAAVSSDEQREVVTALAAGFARYDQAIKDTLDVKSTGAAMAATVLPTAQCGYDRLLARGLLRRMHAASAAVARLADGDLTQPLQVRGHDEVGQLVRNLESVRQRWRRRFTRCSRPRTRSRSPPAKSPRATPT